MIRRTALIALAVVAALLLAIRWIPCGHPTLLGTFLGDESSCIRSQ